MDECSVPHENDVQCASHILLNVDEENRGPLQENYPSPPDTMDSTFYSPPNQSLHHHPPLIFDSHTSSDVSHTPNVPFVYIQTPPVITVGSVSKDFSSDYLTFPSSPVHPSPQSPPICHGQGGCSSLSWQHHSLLHSGLNEHTPLLRSARSDLKGSGNAHACENSVIDSPSSSLSHFSRKQILTLASMLLIDFSSFASMSILAPFFPKQVLRLNLGPTFDGIVFSVYALVIVIASPIVGKMLPMMNLRKVYLIGIMVAALSNILFGLTEYINTAEVFVITTISLRIIAALGTSAFLTVIYSIVPVLFPDDMNMVNGMMETAVGIGMCVGPAVGVWLYSIGGFGFPFYGLGSFIIFCAFINYFTFPSDEISVIPSSESVGLMRILCQAGTILPLVILCITATSLALLYPTLQPHMSKLGVSVEGVGLVFLLMSAVYAFSSPLVGLATDRFQCPWGFMSSGLLIMAVALVLLGNSPLLPYLPHKELYIQDIVAIVFLGLTSAMCIVPTYAAVLDSATSVGEVNIAIYAVVGGLWSSSYSLGEVLGPFLAGLMAEYTTFAMSTTVIAILPAALAIVCGAFMCVKRHQSREISLTEVETSS